MCYVVVLYCELELLHGLLLVWLCFLWKNNRLAGIFTERDVHLSVIGNDAVLTQPVSAHMTCNPVCVGTQDSVQQVLLLMHRGGYRQIPILDAGGDRSQAVSATRISLNTWSITSPHMCSTCHRTLSRLHGHRKVTWSPTSVLSHRG